MSRCLVRHHNSVVFGSSFKIDSIIPEKIFTETQDIFVMQTFVRVKKSLHDNQDSLKVDAHQAYTVVVKHVEASTPIWIIIVSILAGILLLAILTYVLYKMGFFKRKRPADRMNLVKDGEVRLFLF